LPRCWRAKTRAFTNKGIDWRGILRAAVRDITSGSAKEGASSITQQLARTASTRWAHAQPEVLEAMVALRIERQFTKTADSGAYVNRIYFAPVVMALRPLHKLTLAKAHRSWIFPKPRSLPD